MGRAHHPHALDARDHLVDEPCAVCALSRLQFLPRHCKVLEQPCSESSEANRACRVPCTEKKNKQSPIPKNHIFGMLLENTVRPIEITFASPGESVTHPRLQHIFNCAAQNARQQPSPYSTQNESHLRSKDTCTKRTHDDKVILMSDSVGPCHLYSFL